MNMQYAPDFPFRRCILGTAGLGGVWRRVDPVESVRTILMSLEGGVTAIDTAPAYGDAELYVGQVLKQWKGAKPQVSTKAGRLRSFASNEGYYDYSPEGMEKSVVNSLKVLNVPVIDILFLHEPAEMNEDNVGKVIEKLLQLKNKRYVQKIGVGGNSPQWFEKYITTDVFDIVTEYNRLDACCINALHTSLPRYQLKGIEYYAASPLHMGLLGGCYDSRL